MRIRTGLAAVLLAASLAFAGDVEKLVEQMGGADTSERYAAYRQLVDRKDPSCIGPIVERIAAWDTGAQSYGVSILRTLPADSTEGVWRRLLGSPSPYLRVVAGRLVTDKEKGAKVVAEAFATPKLTEDVLQMMLGQVNGAREPVITKAVRAFVRADAPAAVVSMALQSLAYADDRDTLPAARALAANGDAARKAIAAAWLLRFGVDDAAGALAEGLRAGAVAYMDFIRMRPWIEAADHVPPVVLDALVERLGVETAQGWLCAIAGILGHERHAPAVPALRKLLDHAEAPVSLAAFEALTAIPGALDRDSLKSQLESKDPARRLAAAEALRRSDDLSGLPVVAELVRTSNPVRWQAAQALGAYRTDEVVEPLLQAMVCDDHNTRLYASASLSNVLRTLFPYRRLDFQASGYRYDGTDGAGRTEAVERIRKWWADHRDRAW